MTTTTLHPALALDLALRAIDEEVRRAERRRLVRELRTRTPRRRPRRRIPWPVRRPLPAPVTG